MFMEIAKQTFRFLNGKIESLFLQRKNPRKIHWTQVFRKMHKKGITEEGAFFLLFHPELLFGF